MSVPPPIFSIGRAPPTSEITPDCVAVPVSTLNWVVLLVSTVGLAILMPPAESINEPNEGSAIEPRAGTHTCETENRERPCRPRPQRAGCDASGLIVGVRSRERERA